MKRYQSILPDAEPFLLHLQHAVPESSQLPGRPGGLEARRVAVRAALLNRSELSGLRRNPDFASGKALQLTEFTGAGGAGEFGVGAAAAARKPC